MRTIHALKDYRGYFYSSTRLPDVGMDVGALTEAFADRGVRLSLHAPTDLDLAAETLRGEIVLYQATQDRGLFYKGYVEDLLLGLHSIGAVLVPRFELFRAHHNKVFQEVLRAATGLRELRNLESRIYGTWEELCADPRDFEFPVVVKTSEGAISAGVRLATTRRQLERHARRLSRSFHLRDALMELVKSQIRPHHVRQSNHRRKFVVQQFVPGLDHDYKVLVYGRRVFVMRRDNRPGDFRASGSGRFSWDFPAPDGLLEFSRRIQAGLDSPFVALDVGQRGSELFVFEFQCVTFGNIALEQSPFHYVHDGGQWRQQPGRVKLEEIFAESIVEYLADRGA